MTSTGTTRLPVAVIGAGPVGLTAASHLAEREMPFMVFEAGPAVAASIAEWGHVRLFTPWRYLTDATAVRRLGSGWERPESETLPTGREFIDQYLAPLASTLTPFVHLDSRVTSVGRLGVDKVKSNGRDAAPFVVRVEHANGTTEEHLAGAVIDASGTWKTPNPLGAGGTPATGEVELSDAISYGIPDVLGRERSRYEGRTTLVLGAGHSAANAILDLLALAGEAPATTAIWAVRGPTLSKAFGGGDADELPARGKLGLRLREAVDQTLLSVKVDFKVAKLERESGGRIRVTALDGSAVVADQIIGATGQRPDLALTRELRLDLDPWLESPRQLAPLIDPNIHHCGSVPPHGFDVLSHPETGYFVAGVKSYGRAPTFLTMTGYEQVRSIVAALAGDLASARRLELVLPETGVCITDYDAAPTNGQASVLPEPVLAATGSVVAATASPDTAGAGCACGPSQAEPALVGAGSTAVGLHSAGEGTATGGCCG